MELDAMRRLNLIYIMFILSFFGNAAMAYVFGGSNLGFLGYPKHSCSQPYKPFQFTSQSQVNMYNADLEVYFNCIDSYVENAKNDIDRIIEAANEAISEANSF